MNPQTLLPILGELLVKSALVFTAALLVNAAWHSASAAQRHLVWCAALATVLLLPLTRLHAPRWTVPLQRVTLEFSRQPRADLPPIESVTTSAASANPLPAAPRWRWPDWKQAIIVVWSMGAGLLLASRLLGSARLVWLRKTTQPLMDARTQRMAAEIFAELGIRRTVELRLSPAGGVPLTWGSLRPVLTLPAEALAWSEARLAAALRHEAGHIARGDHFTRSIAHFACALYWPNPLVWLAARSLRTAQEQATDDLVLRGGTAPDEYAEQLFDVARALAAQHRFARHAVAMASPSTLERRMLAIVDESRDRRPLSLRAVFGGMLAVTLTLGLSTAAQLQAEERKAAGESAATVPRTLIMIEAKFVEITATVKAKSPLLGTILGNGPASKETTGAPSVAGVFTEPQFAAVMRELNAQKGVDLLSAPRVTTGSGQRAVIEIIREFRYPTEYEKDGPGWKEKESATRNTGVTFEVLATVRADGTIDLEMTPSVVEFLGAIDLDNGTKYPATVSVPSGHRSRPVFSERKITSTASVGPGQTVVLGTLGAPPESKDFPKQGPARKLTVFVTASLVKQAPPVVAEANPNPMMEIILPLVEFKDAKLSDAGALLLAKGRAAGATTLNIVVVKRPTPEPIVTLSMSRVSIAEAVQNLADISGAGIRRDGNTYVLGEEPAPDAGKPTTETPPKAAPPAAGSGTLSVSKGTLTLSTDSKSAPSTLVLSSDNLPNSTSTLTLKGTSGAKTESPEATIHGAGVEILPKAKTGAAPPVEATGSGTTRITGSTGTTVITDSQNRGGTLTLTGKLPEGANLGVDPFASVIIPRIEFRDATLSEAVEFLIAKGRASGGAPVNIVVLSAPKPEPTITLSLTDIPLTDAIRYIAELSGLKVRRDASAFVLEPKAADK